MPDLTELLARVKVATGPARELDIAITRQFVHGKFYQTTETAGPYTSSIDAALALTERVLPGWKRSLFEKRGGAGWVARVSSPRYETSSSGEDTPMPTASLALLAATLSALITREVAHAPGA